MTNERWWFVSSYGKSGPYATEESARARADDLAITAAVEGHDDERPRIESSDGTIVHLPPFGALLRADAIQLLPSPGRNLIGRAITEERANAATLARLFDGIVDTVRSAQREHGKHIADEGRYSCDPGTINDNAARAVYLWSVRRALIAMLGMLPETHATRDSYEREWFGARRG